MLYRPAFIPLIVLFWVVTSGWLVVTKILPSLTPGSPPGYQAYHVSNGRLLPVAWSVLWNDELLGWATSLATRSDEGGLEVYSLLHFDRLPIDKVLPQWAKMMLPTALDATASYAFDAHGRLSIDPRGELRTFSSVVNIPATGGRVLLDGRIDDGEVNVDVRAHGVEYNVSRHIPRHLTIGDELSPQATLPGLYPDRQWTVPVYSPLRPGQSPIQILHARVAGEESMEWEGRMERVHVVHYRDDPSLHREPKCRLWVDRGGRVLKQESLMLGAKLVFVRQSDADAEALTNGAGKAAAEAADPRGTSAEEAS